MRELNKKEIRNVLILIIISVSIMFLFHVFRFSKTSILPIYDQYKYNDITLILPFIIGVVNTILIYLILQKMVTKYSERFFITLVIIMSPIFTYVHCTQNSIYIGLCFLLLGFLFLLWQNYIFSGIFLILSFIFNQSFIFIILILLIIFLERIHAKILIISITSIIILTYIFSQINNIEVFGLHDLITNYVSDFGAVFGLGSFSIILFILGIILSWSNKSKNIMIYLGLISILVMSLFDKTILLFADLMISFFAGKAIYYLYNRNWDSEILKNYVLVIIFCGLIFTSGAYIKRISDSGPYEEEILSLKWLSYQEKGNVISDYRYGHIIRSLSGFEPYTDKDYYKQSKNRERILETDKIFQSRDLNEIKYFLEQNNISYFWINKEMKNIIWGKKDQGILLILQNSRYFSKIYDYGVEIWRFNKEID